MKHYGDITKLSGYELPVVDIITGGSPCQNLSIAGNRQGLNGSESRLFIEQIRLIKEMRQNDKASGRANEFIRPRYMVWENVPGAFSSNGGEDFRIVLEETARIVDESATIPRPPGGDGNHLESSWEQDIQSLGEYMMPNIGVCLKDEREYVYLLISTETQPERFFLNCSEKPISERKTKLSDILETNPDPKYNLSAKACQGILRRAERRKKKLPEILYKALVNQVGGVQKNGIDQTSLNKYAVCATQQAIGEYKVVGVASALKQRDNKDATDLVIQDDETS